VNTVFNGHATSLMDSISQAVTGAGAMDFSFQTIDPQYMVANGTNRTVSACCGPDEGVFGIVTTSTTLANGATFADLLIYNDPVPGGDHDYNDLVVGVNFTPSVPEPASIALIGLGLAGLGLTRRKRKAA